jgi:IS30 family transposase
MSQERYKRVSQEEREEISRRLANGVSLRKIARSINRHISTVSREVNHGYINRESYRAVTAHNRAIRNASKRKKQHYKIGSNPLLQRYIHEKLRTYWSPEQIAKALKSQYSKDKSMHASHETIYDYLFVQTKGSLKKELLGYLRSKQKRRHTQGKQPGQRKALSDMVMIDERPPEVMKRAIPGHWEGDLIIGKNRQSAIGTLVERKTRFAILVPLKNRSAPEVRKAFAKEIKKLPAHLHLSLTYDQGREMAEHKIFTKMTNMHVYFCHPASPWERGTNENTNGLVRQFFPKATDFTTISRKEIKRAQHLLNGRPRKTLGFQTPYEAYQKVLR